MHKLMLKNYKPFEKLCHTYTVCVSLCSLKYLNTSITYLLGCWKAAKELASWTLIAVIL